MREHLDSISSAGGCESVGELRHRRGRPAGDHFARRTELFFAALPLLERRSGGDVTMEHLASATGMSVGGLRYYFPTRDELVFFPLLPGNCDAMYMALVRSQGSREDPGALVGAFLESFGEAAVASRVAARLAVEAGAQFFRRLANSHPEADWVELRVAIAELGGHSRAFDARWLQRFLRREFIGASLEEGTEARDVATDLRYALGMTR